MAKLKDLLPKVTTDKSTITIQGVKLPVAFTMMSMEYVQEAYGKSFQQFQSDFDKILNKKNVTLGPKELRLVNSLIYAMVRTGGTETTVDELMNAIPFNEMQSVYTAAMKIFNTSFFQTEDAEKLGAKK